MKLLKKGRVEEAKAYSEFRQAFGKRISEFPLVAAQIEEMERRSRETTATAFHLYCEFHRKDRAKQTKRQQFALRELIMLQKIGAAWDATDVIRSAMSAFWSR